jgi:glucose-6-phosphate-specific signal transduction histidine kinase
MRVLAAGDAERRRIERRLHDDVQQHLVALAVNLQLARELVGTDDEAARTLLEQMSRDLREALESARAMAQEIYPPLLVDRGLADALRGAAADAGARIDVTVAERFAPEIEATIYFLCVELLHPGATIRVWTDDGALHVDAKSDGQVTTTISDRVSSLGGALAADPGRVTAKIPVEP